jgi:hypothetical protein
MVALIAAQALLAGWHGREGSVVTGLDLWLRAAAPRGCMPQVLQWR